MAELVGYYLFDRSASWLLAVRSRRSGETLLPPFLFSSRAALLAPLLTPRASVPVPDHLHVHVLHVDLELEDLPHRDVQRRLT